LHCNRVSDSKATDFEPKGLRFCKFATSDLRLSSDADIYAGRDSRSPAEAAAGKQHTLLRKKPTRNGRAQDEPLHNSSAILPPLREANRESKLRLLKCSESVRKRPLPLAGFAVVLCVSMAHAAGHNYSTSFQPTENPIYEHGNWINGGTTGLDWTNVQTSSGMAIGTQADNGSGNAQYSDSTAVLAGNWGPNQIKQPKPLSP
jgi:hypothetical protein